jgi:DNA (cytosine-5)-methyltransferase 1
MIKIADFFAGVGGIRLGFEQASNIFDCVFTNEIDKFAIQTYEANFLSHKVTNKSIEDLSEQDIPDFDIFLGGFPCQSFSVAGKQLGFEDSRGNLFFSIVRILEMKQPKCFLLENVKNLLVHDNGNTFDIIKQELCDLGYAFRYKILNYNTACCIPQAVRFAHSHKFRN